MLAFVTSHHEQHAPTRFLVRGEWRPCPETPERAAILRAALAAAGHEIASPPPCDLAPIRAVHEARYLDFLERGHAAWRALSGAGAEMIANMHPNRIAAGGYPDSIVGRAGYHMADTACPIDAGTWSAARASAEAAIAAARYVASGAASSAYALCRPPGHHASANLAGGFCYLNNSAIAAQELRRRFARVAIVDVDLHHGNGTQAIFYRRGDVFTLSLHADPAHFYPFFWGYAGEIGEGEGRGANLNLPLPLGSGDSAFLQALDGGLARLREFAPGAIVIALGLDAAADDPFAGLSLDEAGFHAIGVRLGALGLPSVIVQEGGYVSPNLGRNLIAALAGFSGE